jgi:hypothetical protein
MPAGSDPLDALFVIVAVILCGGWGRASMEYAGSVILPLDDAVAFSGV